MENTNDKNPNPRWFALVNDRVVIVPQRTLKVSLLKQLSLVTEDNELLRDYQSTHDESFLDSEDIDLSEGNVFRITKKQEKPKKHSHNSPPKKAFCVDDRFEIFTIPEMSLETFIDLFSLQEDVVVFRDFESPNDKPIDDDHIIKFVDGPTFITRKIPFEITIIVNGREKKARKRFLSYEDVVSLAFSNPNFENVMYTVTYKRGSECSKEGSLVRGQTVRIRKGMIFNVTNTDKS